MTTAETCLTLERDGGLVHLILDGAPKNELTFRCFDALGELIEGELSSMTGVRGLVISGRGRHFSSGSDLSELLEQARVSGNERSPSWCEVHAGHFRALSRLPYPVVAAISGCCLGSALELTLACTARVAAQNAMLALPEAQHGLIPGLGGTVRLTELIGYRQAARLILSGEPIGARRALALGLVDRVASRKELLETAGRLASCLAGQPAA